MYQSGGKKKDPVPTTPSVPDVPIVSDPKHYTFTIYKNNVMKLDDDGDGEKKFKPTDLAIPNPPTGYPTTLPELATLVGVKNMSISYYVQATGSVSSHDCWASYTLSVQADMVKGSDPKSTNKIAIWSTDNNPGRGGAVASGWQALANNVSAIIDKLKSSEDCHGSGCWCAFESKGGWEKTNISLRIDVVVDLVGFCTTEGAENMHSTICFNYISDFITQNGPTQQISTYLANYCKAKFPKGGLSNFNDPKKGDHMDFQLCACNMPDSDYQGFLQSIRKSFPKINLGSIRPNCLLPACVTSPFKNSEIGKCDLIPQCLNVVTFRDNNIAGNVDVNQDQNCSSFGIDKGAGGSDATGVPTDDKTGGMGFVRRYRYLIIAIFAIFFVLLLMGFVIWWRRRKGKNNKGRTKVKAKTQARKSSGTGRRIRKRRLKTN